MDLPRASPACSGDGAVAGPCAPRGGCDDQGGRGEGAFWTEAVLEEDESCERIQTRYSPGDMTCMRSCIPKTWKRRLCSLCYSGLFLYFQDSCWTIHRFYCSLEVYQCLCLWRRVVGEAIDVRDVTSFRLQLILT